VSITVYGHSDDLIEVEGDIHEEFDIDHDGHGKLFGFSDGTIIQVEWTKVGIWRITPMIKGSGELTIIQAPVDDDSNYSDRATLDADVRWVMRGSNLVAKR
jgi:hypothetical protein